MRIFNYKFRLNNIIKSTDKIRLNAKSRNSSINVIFVHIMQFVFLE